MTDVNRRHPLKYNCLKLEDRLMHSVVENVCFLSTPANMDSFVTAQPKEQTVEKFNSLVRYNEKHQTKTQTERGRVYIHRSSITLKSTRYRSQSTSNDTVAHKHFFQSFIFSTE